ncbi:SIR2 family protein [Microbacterium sp. ASV81]|uniref:SIR2 family protein n=1 Tax=Microbacterium capsulatum TaxID=3041921 RepID=A0ABU0XIV1_9MICO|nr:SIR2 family protein [Microbacterium sp. ASV81]MDQ4215069.1 SIR2 family protein [Microbacterium sp. ASV81]
MSQPLSPLVSLATSMHSQPGVYAVMLGSGVSTGAGLLTGWGVVTELVSRVAAAGGGDDEVEVARADPEAWWKQHGSGDLGYSTLLEQLAPSAAARQGLLAGFFEPGADDDAGALREPSRAHHAIAELMKRGSVRVIVTTNFDRLMEHALESIGISPQVIARPEAVNGMAPLAHAPATIIKLHGDYRDLGSRNTPAELSEYPDEWKRLLAQVFDEYGLVISGWSADWDHALVAALEDAPSRRYPLYWDQRSSRGDAAQRILAARDGRVLPASSADDLFGELVESLEALDRLSSPPLTTAMAVARLKRYLPDPVRRIDLHDLVMNTVDEVVDFITAQPVTAETVSVGFDVLDTMYAGYFATMEKLAPLLITGVWHDDGTHDSLWADVVQRLIDAGSTVPTHTFNSLYLAARLIPALASVALISITATRRGREGLLLSIVEEVDGPTQIGIDQRVNAAQVLHYGRVIVNEDNINGFTRWGGNKWLYPASHLFTAALRHYLIGLIPNKDDYEKAFRGFEYRLGLIQRLTSDRAISGEYVGEWAWRGEEPVAEIELRKVIDRGRGTAWEEFFTARELTVDAALTEHRAVIVKYQRWG